jgi:hypothetical protein
MASLRTSAGSCPPCGSVTNSRSDSMADSPMCTRYFSTIRVATAGGSTDDRLVQSKVLAGLASSRRFLPEDDEALDAALGVAQNISSVQRYSCMASAQKRPCRPCDSADRGASRDRPDRQRGVSVSAPSAVVRNDRPTAGCHSDSVRNFKSGAPDPARSGSRGLSKFARS